MSSPGTPKPTTPSGLLQTIEADLSSGVSWLEHEALDAGLFLWNTLKAAFIALEPAEGQILLNLLTGAVNDAAGGKAIETIATDALNSASAQEKAVFQKAGFGAASVIIAGLNSKFTPPGH